MAVTLEQSSVAVIHFWQLKFTHSYEVFNFFWRYFWHFCIAHCSVWMLGKTHRFSRIYGHMNYRFLTLIQPLTLFLPHYFLRPSLIAANAVIFFTNFVATDHMPRSVRISFGDCIFQVVQMLLVLRLLIFSHFNRSLFYATHCLGSRCHLLQSWNLKD